MLFLLLSILLNTVFAACYKVAVRRSCQLEVVNVWMYIGSLITAAAYILWKGSYSLHTAAFWMGTLSGIFGYFATLTFFFHIIKGQLSSSWTVISLSVAFPVLASIFAWHEYPNTMQTVGLLLIAVALVLFGRHETGNSEDEPLIVPDDLAQPAKSPAPGGARKIQAMSFLLLMIAFVLSGMISIVNKALIQFGFGEHRDSYLLGYFIAPTILGVFHLASHRKFGDSADRKVGLVMGLGGGTSTLFLLLALQGMPGIVAFPVRSLGNLVVTGLVSIVAWKERLSRSQWLGIALSLIALKLIY